MEVSVLGRAEIDPSTWDKFIGSSPQGMIYACYDYMTALDKTWQAIIVKKNETIQAVMPLVIRKKAGIHYSLQPVFTQYWGIMFRPVDSSISRAFELKKQLVKLIIEHIPDPIKLFNYNFSPAFDYPLPFYWNDYDLLTRYTNQIDLKQTEEALWANVSEKTRSLVRKVEKSGITVTKSNDINTVIAIFRNAKGDVIKNMKDADYTALSEIAKHYASKGMSYTLIAADENGNALAGALYFTFKDTTIHFFGSTLPEYKSSGAMSLVIWEGIS